METEEYSEDNTPIAPPPSHLFTNLLTLQAEVTQNCLSALFSPVLSLVSLGLESHRRAEAAKETVDSAVHNAVAGIPSTAVQSSGLLLRKLGVGLLGAAYVCMVLIALMVTAVVLGVGLVQLWVEEPVFVRERLRFDYAEVYPNAVFDFREYSDSKKKMGVPVGQTFYVSLVLLMPESDYNRDVGMFQLIAEIISTSGNVIAKSSHPCMLPFRSLPIRLTRTFLLSIPLLLGITSETQKITIPMVRHKEGFPRTEAIKITLVPRAGTMFLPQLYEAEILMNSELPWRKQLVHSWKWTFYVWTSVYMYIMLLIVVACCFRPLIFPVMSARLSHANYDQDRNTEVPRERQTRSRGDREVSETLRRWKESGIKRKAMLPRGVTPELAESSASSISVTRDDSSSTVEDGGGSESVFFKD